MAGSIPGSATSRAPLVRVAAPLVTRPREWRVWRALSGGLGVGITGALLTMALLAGRIAPVDPFASVAPPLRPPSMVHPMGTDDLGRDLLAGVIYGARTSLLVALTVTALASFVGIAVGAVSGWRGGDRKSTRLNSSHL